MEVKDLFLNEDLDFAISADGDLVIDESTTQHQALIIMTNKGDWRPVPFIGVGIDEWIEDDTDLLGFQHEIAKQFELDGMKVNSIKGSTFQDTTINAEYK